MPLALLGTPGILDLLDAVHAMALAYAAGPSADPTTMAVRIDPTRPRRYRATPGFRAGLRRCRRHAARAPPNPGA
ncbi:hypothetical protein [Embleya sp. NPDC059237]|uniref:hypothetical protein n=1 Tax=Embleya sp. NPDC059237 TaxID=3346784 RepID=UPI0036B1BBF7